MNIVVFDLGGTEIKHALMNEHAEILESHIVPTPPQHQQLTLPLLFDIIETYRSKVTIDGIAFSVPGNPDGPKKLMRTAGAIYDLDDVDFSLEFENRFQVPVSVENDVNCVALAEQWQGAAQDLHNFVCITYGTGIGGGIVLNNALYTGDENLAGEFHHLIVGYTESDEPIIYGSVASTKQGLVKPAARALGIEPSKLNGKKIFALAETDERVQVVLEQFYRNIAKGLATISICFNVQAILIGGGISARPDLIENIERHLHQIPCHFAYPKLIACHFKNDAGKIGALRYFLGQINNL